MLLEVHCHTSEHSTCSHVSARHLVEKVFHKGLQGIVLTDHHYLWSPEELEELKNRCGLPEHFLILAGQEVKTAELGDVLVYGATQVFVSGTSVLEIRRRFPEAALVLAHPYRKERTPPIETLLHPALDAIEIFNSNQSVRENSRGLQDWHLHRFTAVAGTDTHAESYAGLYPTLFDHPISDIGGLAREIRHGRCRPFLKEIPKAGAQNLVTEVTIGVKGVDERRERLIIRTLPTERSWRKAQRAHAIMTALAENGFDGGSFRVPRPIDENRAERTVIQEGVRGKSLLDKLRNSTTADRRHYVELAGRWLARLHGCRLRVTPEGEFWDQEQIRLARYLKRFEKIDHPHRRRAREVMENVLEREERILRAASESMVQAHGDFHPKNLIVGQDLLDDRSSLYVAAIDFESSFLMPAAYDVGTFLAQYRNQLYPWGEILRELPESLFLEAYLQERGAVPDDFGFQVSTFRARTNLSIAAYLIKLGLGDSENLWRVLVEAEEALSTAVPGQEEPRSV